MHSTVQTGLYTQNVLGYDYNFHHPHGSSNLYNPFPPPHHHHHHHHKQASPSPSSHHTHHHHEINENNHAATTPRSARKVGETVDVCVNPSCNLKSNNSAINIPSMIRHETHIDTLRYKFKLFWQCTKPCGILTLVFGILLLATSIAGFIVLQIESICESAQACSNATIKVCSVTLLVLSIVFIFIGFIIIVYSKRDRQASIIVTSTKHLENLDTYHSNSNNNVHTPLKQNLSSSLLNNEAVALNKTLSASNKNLATSNGQPLLSKASSITALNKNNSTSNSKLNAEEQ